MLPWETFWHMSLWDAIFCILRSQSMENSGVFHRHRKLRPIGPVLERLVKLHYPSLARKRSKIRKTGGREWSQKTFPSKREGLIYATTRGVKITKEKVMTLRCQMLKVRSLPGRIRTINRKPCATCQYFHFQIFEKSRKQRIPFHLSELVNFIP